MTAEGPEMAGFEERRLLFEALLKELQLIRDEELICIAHVRRLPVTATYIVGFSLPIIASIFTLNFTGDPIAGSDMDALVAALQNGGELCAVLALGVSMVCATLMRIYVGAFKQIFNMARYIREHIAPALNRLTGGDIPVLHWEHWLQEHRSRSPTHVGDADLAAEPKIIAGYSMGFALLALALSAATHFFVVGFGLAAFAVLLVLVLSHLDFARVLDAAASPVPPGGEAEPATTDRAA